jgi:hypothetical protein
LLASLAVFRCCSRLSRSASSKFMCSICSGHQGPRPDSRGIRTSTAWLTSEGTAQQKLHKFASLWTPAPNFVLKQKPGINDHLMPKQSHPIGLHEHINIVVREFPVVCSASRMVWLLPRISNSSDSKEAPSVIQALLLLCCGAMAAAIRQKGWQPIKK